MGWKGVTIMDQRIRFISEYLDGYFNVSDLCGQFQISRKTGYKWIDRYEALGPKGLNDQSRRPHQCPHQTSSKVYQAILDLRRVHPTWGPKKILGYLEKRHRNWTYPAISTTADILKREGLIVRSKRHLRRQHPGCPKTQATAPNQIWTADYKGHFKLRNGLYCYPLTICDLYSRYLLGCKAHDQISLVDSREYFTSVFQEYGLPDRIRTDNGVPFASSAIARLSTLSVWWIELGIYPEQIEPGKPQQNGRHERMHRTMKKEATVPPCANRGSQQRRFETFQKEYNEVRPHEALQMKTPSQIYHHSRRPFPKKIVPYDYPGHFDVRLVSRNGGIRWQHHRVPVSQTLIEQYIGFEEIEGGVYNVYFRDFLIGRFFEELGRIKDIIPRIPTRQRFTEKCYPCT